MKLVLDTGVLMLVLIGDPDVRNIIRLVRSGAEAYTAATNLAELRYKVEEKLGKAVALTWVNRLLRTPAVALALALNLGAKLVTTDEALENVEEVEVQVIKF